RYMKRYIDSYIERKYREKHNRLPTTDEEYDTIIKITGAQIGMKYEESGIFSMLKDKRINNLLQAEFEKNTIQFEGRRVPKVVKDYYFAETNGIVEEVEAEIKQRKYYGDIKDDSTDELKMKLFVIKQEIKQRKDFEDMIDEYDEVGCSRSPESIYYYEVEE